MEEAVEPPEAKRPRVDAEATEEEDEGLEGLGGACQGLEGPAPSSWLPSSAGSESQEGPSSVDSGLSGVTNKIQLVDTIVLIYALIGPCLSHSGRHWNAFLLLCCCHIHAQI